MFSNDSNKFELIVIIHNIQLQISCPSGRLLGLISIKCTQLYIIMN